MKADRWFLTDRVDLEDTPDGGGGVLCDLHTAELCACNATAWTVMRRLASGAGMDDLITVVCAEFEIAAEDASADIAQFLDKLSAMGFARHVRQ